jgi:hypothetical protein
MNACAPVQNMAHIGKQEKAHSQERNSEEQHAGVPQVGIFQHLEPSNSPEPLSRERKVLQNAISFFGFRLLNDPQLVVGGIIGKKISAQQTKQFVDWLLWALRHRGVYIKLDERLSLSCED